MRDDEKKRDDPPARFVIDWPAGVEAITKRSLRWAAEVQGDPGGYRDPRVVFDPARLAAVAAALDGLTFAEGAAILDGVIMGAALHVDEIRELLPSPEAASVGSDLIKVARLSGEREGGLALLGVGMTQAARTARTNGKEEVKH